MAVYSFRPEPIIQYIEKQSTKAVMRATAIAVKNAQRHAPVRKIFKGTTYTTKNGFRAPVIRRVLAGDVQRTGHANSFRPLLSKRVGNTTTYFAGDFRRVGGGEREFRFSLGQGAETYEKGTQRLGKLGGNNASSTIGEQTPAAFGRHGGTKYGREGGTADTGEVAVFQKVSGGKIKQLRTGDQAFSGSNFLSTRGRFEVRSGRANFTSPEDGVTRVGGRLRGEIHAEGPETKGGIIWGYVVSATKDPETGRLYPRDQEFGTSHNRPHPFLRPGLHDSRGALKREMRDAVRLGQQ